MSLWITFVLKNKTYSFLGNSYLHESFYAGDSVKVIYDPQSPQSSYVNSWIGIWGPEIVNAIPFLVIFYLILGVNYIPERIVIKF